jgi:hypothetical protein
MSDAKNQAAELRREADLCLEIADRVSIREARERMTEFARQLLVLAEETEAKEGASARLSARAKR